MNSPKMPHNYFKLLLAVCVLFCFIIGCLLNWAPSEFETCKCNQPNEEENKYQRQSLIAETQPEWDSSKPRLAIIVPFRDRFEELLQFAPHMQQFLNAQKIPHRIFVMNQVDRFRFNRASLINVGFMFTEDRFDYIAMHDVDLLPQNEQLVYGFPKLGPLHIAAPELHPKYHYPTFVGGILLVAKTHFRLMNGMSNKYWGWGLEDDEFYVRIMDAGLKVYRPQNIRTGVNDTFKHIHDRRHRQRDMTKCYNQREETRRRDRDTGLDTLKYKIATVHNLTMDNVPVTVVNVQLECDRSLTPWCDCEGAPLSPTGTVVDKTKRSSSRSSSDNVKKKAKTRGVQP